MNPILKSHQMSTIRKGIRNSRYICIHDDFQTTSTISNQKICSHHLNHKINHRVNQTRQSNRFQSRNYSSSNEYEDMFTKKNFNDPNSESNAMQSPFQLSHFLNEILPQNNKERIKEWLVTCLRIGKHKVLLEAFSKINDSLLSELKKEIPSHIAKIYYIDARYLDVVKHYESLDKSLISGMDLVYLRAAYLESLVHLFKDDEAISNLSTFLKEHKLPKEKIVLTSSLTFALCNTGSAVKANSLRKEVDFPLTILARLAIIRGLIQVKEYELAFINYVYIENTVLQYIKEQKFVFSNETLYDIRDKLCGGGEDIKKRVKELPSLPPRDSKGLNQSNVVYSQL